MRWPPEGRRWMRARAPGHAGIPAGRAVARSTGGGSGQLGSRLNATDAIPLRKVFADSSEHSDQGHLRDRNAPGRHGRTIRGLCPVRFHLLGLARRYQLRYRKGQVHGHHRRQDHLQEEGRQVQSRPLSYSDLVRGDTRSIRLRGHGRVRVHREGHRQSETAASRHRYDNVPSLPQRRHLGRGRAVAPARRPWDTEE